MSDAGPSRLNGHSASHRNGQTQDRRSSGKRKLFSGVDEIFEKQSIEEKARLGREYREMQAEADDMKANQANITANDLAKHLTRQQALFDQVRDTGTAALDARLMLTTADTAFGLARKMKLDNNDFDVDDFIIKLKSCLGLDRPDMDNISEDEDEDQLDESLERASRRRVRDGPLGDWEKVGWMAAKYSRRVPGVEFMYGPLTIQHKKRQIGPRQRKKSLEPEVRPEEIQTQQKSKEDAKDTASLVKEVINVLRKTVPPGGTINYFRFVINPDDYSQTVENVFYTSFMVKEGHAGVRVLPNGEIILEHVNEDEQESQAEKVRNQAVVELDMDTWEEAKRLFNIKECVIPHRRHTTQVMTANGWYT
ncbi:hypothetical protein M231_04677 [Tremella mesenterica]|uniref:Non-structural maintenance of chromosomes element 4 n=1 Tax=Tremella mesenterica TaxID=5217 RepID=A0A4Q1BJT7_TREME|nr:hypothetical protein M231_04677 [Tremella mesenterica]